MQNNKSGQFPMDEDSLSNSSYSKNNKEEDDLLDAQRMSVPPSRDLNDFSIPQDSHKRFDCDQTLFSPDSTSIPFLEMDDEDENEDERTLDDTRSISSSNGKSSNTSLHDCDDDSFKDTLIAEPFSATTFREDEDVVDEAVADEAVADKDGGDMAATIFSQQETNNDHLESKSTSIIINQVTDTQAGTHWDFSHSDSHPPDNNDTIMQGELENAGNATARLPEDKRDNYVGNDPAELERFESKSYLWDKTGKPDQESDALKGTVLQPGMILNDQYRLLKAAGAGKMGVVWLAEDILGNRKIALKFVSRNHPLYNSLKSWSLASFQLTHELNHQYICPQYAIHNDEKNDLGYYIVMKWQPNTLDTYLKDLRQRGLTLPPEEITLILTQLAEALDYVHSKGIIHRDVKPANIAVEFDEDAHLKEINLIDFGEASSIQPISGVEKKRTMGTPSYMSPEQWTDTEQNAQTDQYALACIAYELYSGHVPFKGPSFNELKRIVLNDRVAPIPNVNHWVQSALQRALSKKKKDRFSSCVEFVQALSGNTPSLNRLRRIITRTAIALSVLALLVAVFVKNDTAPPEANRSVFTPYNLVSYNATKLPFGFTARPEQMKDQKAPSFRDELLKPSQQGLFIDGKQYGNSAGEQNGKGWTYRFDSQNRIAFLTLNGYNGSGFHFSGSDLTVVVADGSENCIQSNEKDCITVFGGSLTITGDKLGNGKLSFVVSAPSPTAKNGENKILPVFSAVALESSNKNLTIQNLARLSIESTVDGTGLFVRNGYLFLKDIAHFSISGSRMKDALFIGGQVYACGKKGDLWSFDRGIWCGNSLMIIDSTTVQSTKKEDKKSNVTDPYLEGSVVTITPPFDFSVLGKKIDFVVRSAGELDEVLKSGRKNAVVAVAADLVTGANSQSIFKDKLKRQKENIHSVTASAGTAVEGYSSETVEATDKENEPEQKKSSMVLPNSNQNKIDTLTVHDNTERTFLAFGNRQIRRGFHTAQTVEVLQVKGDLKLGLPSGMGTSTLDIDGGAIMQKRMPLSGFTAKVDLSNVVIKTNSNKIIDIHRFFIVNEVNYPLVTLFGKMTMNQGICFQNNANIVMSNIKRHGTHTSENSTGGLYIAKDASFEMNGGEIRFCIGSKGGGVDCHGRFVMTKGSICDNVAANDNGSKTSEGGGLRISESGIFEMRGGEISHNLALANTTNVSGTAAAKGGGMHVGAHGKVVLLGGKISNNVSLWGGGAIYSGGNGQGETFIGEIEIFDNVAILGAGIMMNSPVWLENTQIRNNSLIEGRSIVASAGAGVYLLDIAHTLGDNFPVLSIAGKTTFGPGNDIFITGNSLALSRGVSDVCFIPLAVIDELNGGEDQKFVINLGNMIKGKSDKNNENKKIHLVVFRHFNKKSNSSLVEQHVSRFCFGVLESSQTTQYQFAHSVITDLSVTNQDDIGKIGLYLEKK